MRTAFALVDAKLPEFVVTPTSRDLATYAAATCDYYEAHYDLEFALASGLPGVIVHGLLKLAYLGRATTAWAGPEAFVRRLDARYRGMDLVNQPFTVRGEVTEVTSAAGFAIISVRLRGISAAGAVSTEGSAIVEIPFA